MKENEFEVGKMVLTNYPNAHRSYRPVEVKGIEKASRAISGTMISIEYRGRIKELDMSWFCPISE